MQLFQRYITTLVLLFGFSGLKAQTGNHLGSLDLQAPVGVFARSHFAGAGLNYSWSHHRYGNNIPVKKWLGFTVNAGGNYYLGKKTKPAGYDFRFDNYIDAYVMAGLMANPWPSAGISLTAGPAIGIYKGNTETGIGAQLIGMYYLQKRIAIGPGVSFRKQSKEDALWSGVVRVSYVF